MNRQEPLLLKQQQQQKTENSYLNINKPHAPVLSFTKTETSHIKVLSLIVFLKADKILFLKVEIISLF